MPSLGSATIGRRDGRGRIAIVVAALGWRSMDGRGRQVHQHIEDAAADEVGQARHLGRGKVLPQCDQDVIVGLIEQLAEQTGRIVHLAGPGRSCHGPGSGRGTGL